MGRGRASIGGYPDHIELKKSQITELKKNRKFLIAGIFLPPDWTRRRLFFRAPQGIFFPCPQKRGKHLMKTREGFRKTNNNKKKVVATSPNKRGGCI